MNWTVRQAVGRPPGRACALPALLLLTLAGPAGGADLAISETVQMDFGAVLDQNGSLTLGVNDNLVADPGVVVP